jgi:hypothetical protein
MVKSKTKGAKWRRKLGLSCESVRLTAHTNTKTPPNKSVAFGGGGIYYNLTTYAKYGKNLTRVTNITHSELHVILRSLTKYEVLRMEGPSSQGSRGDLEIDCQNRPSTRRRQGKKRHTVRPRNRWDIEVGAVILQNNQLDAKFLLYIFISVLYTFRANLCSSSGESIVSIQHLVYVTLCR